MPKKPKAFQEVHRDTVSGQFIGKKEIKRRRLSKKRTVKEKMPR